MYCKKKDRVAYSPPKKKLIKKAEKSQKHKGKTEEEIARDFGFTTGLLRAANQQFDMDKTYVYPDASRDKTSGMTGIGIFFGKDHRQNLSLAIGKTTHPFVGESYAIHVALHKLYFWGEYKGNQVVLRTDCLNVIKALYYFKANNERGFEGNLVKYVLTEQDKKT
ncbi:unnamed protein product, partial [Mesorhabditis belari]|uniref:RNase H type-1 domain-containing protein n=1 Tax=Mesorhabditis belari TaxID=2138241 RepID=A0AAF3F516_9BILA